MKPTISIIMPTAGRQQLRRAIESVVPYLGDADELLIVGDGYQPLAREVAFRFHDVPQIKYSEHDCEESSFGWAQRNVAMQRARGDVLAFLDDDDTWLPNALASIRREAATTKLQRPLIFRREYRRKIDLPQRQLEEPVTIQWTREELIDGEIGTGMLAVPRESGLWCEVPMPMTKIRSGHTDFIWIKHMHDQLWQPGQVKFCRDIIYCCYGHGCGRKVSAG